MVVWYHGTICIEMGQLVKTPGSEVTKYGNLGSKRCLQINGQCVLCMKIGTKQKTRDFTKEKISEKPVCVCVVHLLLNPLNTFYILQIFINTDITCSGQDRHLASYEPGKKKKGDPFPGSGI